MCGMLKLPPVWASGGSGLTQPVGTVVEVKAMHGSIHPVRSHECPGGERRGIFLKWVMTKSCPPACQRRLWPHRATWMLGLRVRAAH